VLALPISDLVKVRVNSYHQRRIQDASRFLTSATTTFTEQCSAHREWQTHGNQWQPARGGQRSLKKLHRSYRHGIEYRFNNEVLDNQWRFTTVRICLFLCL
jgi:hypothetical protein